MKIIIFAIYAVLAVSGKLFIIKFFKIFNNLKI